MTQQSFTPPNYTQTPNELFDVLMRDMTESELRVVMVAVRKIVGWHKNGPEAISISQFMELTGMSRQGVVNGIEAAITRGLLVDAGSGARGVTLYTLNIDTTSQRSRPELVNVVDQSMHGTSQRSRHTKERVKKGKETPSAKQKPAKPTRTPEQIAQDDIAQAWFDAVGGFGTVPTYYRKEAALLIEQGATAELVKLMAAERNAGREDTYKLAWLVEDWSEWNAQRERRAREQKEIERQRRIADQERAWRREMLGGAV